MYYFDNPDTLFVKYSISEIKTIQAKLRDESDAKQEELRLMVGERYRDLLQASTSIMTMAESSRRVVDALYQLKKITSSVSEHKPRHVVISGSEDYYLKTLQSLAAHMRLLLDAPESLWRFLERKEYLNATWLFLLSRVVYRALKNESLAEVPWSSINVNIQTQFPLAQKQWELIRQFRSQIAHRATQFFKERSVLSNTVSSTLLALHLLDSSPLTETLSIFLSQRSRMLDDELRTNFTVVEEKSTNPSERKMQVDNLQKVILDVIEILCDTMCIARDVFYVNENSAHSMIEQHLADFQSGDSSKPLITTASLLSSLPSSAHLFLLPRTISTYNPYIDLASPSTRVEPLILETKLSSWFDKALDALGKQIQVWLRELVNITEMWSTRRKILDYLKMAHRLKENERTSLQDVLDIGVQVRITQLLSLALDGLENTVQKSLQKILRAAEDKSHQFFDVDPAALMFSSLELPPITDTQIDGNLTISPFPLYKATMRNRIEGRTPFLLDIQHKIESQALQIRADMDTVQNSINESQTLQQQVMEIYKGSLLSSSLRLSEILQTFVQGELATKAAHNCNTFVARLCCHLSQSKFMDTMQFASLSEQTLFHTLHRLQDQCIDSWRDTTVLKALHAYEDIITMHNDQFPFLPTRPSGCLTNALIIINLSLYDLGLPKHGIAAQQVFKKLLVSFSSAIAEKLSVKGTCNQLQILWDMSFLLRLQPNSNLAVRKFVAALESASAVTSHVDCSTLVYLPRSQTLFGPIIDLFHQRNGMETEKSKTLSKLKLTPLLRLGTPDVEQDYIPALGIVRPPIRFTMLSISSTEDP